MNTESKESGAEDGVGLERAIILELLRDDHDRKWSREQLMAELESDEWKVGQQAVEETLRRLEQEGLVGLSEQEAWASRAARRFDELGLIGV